MDIDVAVGEYISIRDARLKKQRELDAEYQKELGLRDTILMHLLDQGQTWEGNKFDVEVTSTDEPFITNFPELAEYIREYDALDLLQKRLTPSAVRARWEQTGDIPGVGQAKKHDLKITVKG